MKRKAKTAKAVCLPKPWTIGTLIVIEPYRVDGELPFFEQQIERTHRWFFYILLVQVINITIIRESRMLCSFSAKI
ncbi:hypothetical protein [Photobacterium carnosum]|uniref:hypothetical protein n=1 Tax=Photobacterium carnosum TaxID=2023717 RepID=UPI001E2C1152|nr:hypothetical protein [Photobacterium carnosum]MCD9500368.1 hypothetical protein [Photobacterium carnosum]